MLNFRLRKDYFYSFDKRKEKNKRPPESFGVTNIKNPSTFSELQNSKGEFLLLIAGYRISVGFLISYLGGSLFAEPCSGNMYRNPTGVHEITLIYPSSMSESEQNYNLIPSHCAANSKIIDKIVFVPHLLYPHRCWGWWWCGGVWAVALRQPTGPSAHGDAQCRER